MRVLVAPDGFKGSLSTIEAAEAIRRGLLRARPEVRVDVCPLADGGEGTGLVLARALGGRTHRTSVTGPLGRPVGAELYVVDGGKTVVVEAAQAAGLVLVPEEQRDPTRTTSYGVGELLREALDLRATEIVVALGGTATTDGGAGMAQALGVEFEGGARPMTGGALPSVRTIRLDGRDPRLAATRIVVASDVDNPLTGPEGSARVYAPQKGADEAGVVMLENGLVHLARLAGDEGREPGDGAAGGLGFGLRVFAGARRTSGIDRVLDAVRFDERAKRADLVLTGEGRLDAQSARGKVVDGVARRSAALGVPCVALVGSAGEGASTLLARGLTAYFSICSGPMTESEARKNAATLLEGLAERVLRVVLARA
jgi:glycerate kinase